MRLSAVLAFLWVLVACRPQVVDIELPPHVPRLVVHADWRVGDSSLWLYLGRSVGVLDNALLDSGTTVINTPEEAYRNTAWVENANVELFANGQWAGTFTANPLTRTYQLQLSAPLDTQIRYEILASAAGYPSISTEQRLTGLVAAQIQRWEVGGARGTEGEVLDLLELGLPASGEKRYLEAAMVLSSRDTASGSEPLLPLLQSPDPNVLTFGAGKAYFSYTEATTLLLHISSIDTLQYRAHLRLSSISADQYKYYRALSDYFIAQSNPFAEPVVLYSNIDAGRGLFSLRGENWLTIVE